MGKAAQDDMRELLVRSELALGMLQVDFATFLGVSDRTMRRWQDRGTRLLPSTLGTLVTAVHPKDPDLASRLAAHHGYTLGELGIGLTADEAAARAMVLAAAQIAEVAPRTMRSALAAALRAARESGLTLEAAEALLATPGQGKKRR